MAKEKAKKQRNLRKRNAITGYFFISPFIIGFLVFLIKPMIESFQMSLSKVTVAAKEAAGSKGFNMELIKTWKESNYYRAFFYDPDYKNRLVDSLKNMAIQVPAIIIFSFFIALLLNQEFKGRGFVRAIFFLPVILSSGVIVGLEYNNTLMSGMESAIKEAGNFVPVASIEGTEESNDDRRGEGSYQTTIEAMEKLKKHGIFFGMSVCYTSKNVDFVTSDEFIDKMIDLGVPVGAQDNVFIHAQLTSLGPGCADSITAPTSVHR